MSRHRFIPKRVRKRIKVGHGVSLLDFGDGDRYGVEHECTRWPDPQEKDGEFIKVVAPRLHPTHVVTRTDAGITIRASIACPDCGLHGYITDSQWKPVG